ncbi:MULTISPECIES: hypothetical protein [unclassified Bradyrhizobium]|uniref:hypothetical protein n=3 Tax=unclassified Bradyrhizobium TaxID=2631580 RepID=UPI0028E626AE|nr:MULTISPECIES: hypothetical protein [unclassified Bradyrhizobium]
MEMNMTYYKLWLKVSDVWTYQTKCTGDALPKKKEDPPVELTRTEGLKLKSNHTYRITNLQDAPYGLYVCESITDEGQKGEFKYSAAVSAGQEAVVMDQAIAASTTYTIDFQNNTPDTWTLSVYQTLPASPGLKSLSWKQTTVPKSGESGVQWNINYLVGVANYKQSGGKGVYKASQKLGTQLGQKWACRFESGAQQLFEDGGANPGQVLIQNKSGELANLGIGMDGDLALVQSNVYSGNGAQFEVAPVYWVALYKDVVQGEVISGNQVHGPLQVVFPGGVTQLTYEAYIDGSEFVFGLQGGKALRAPLDQVEQRLRMLSAA